MRIIHIVPSAFDYFDDIRASAFQLVDGLYEIGVNVEVFTLQYGSVNKKLKERVSSESTSHHNYAGSVGEKDLIKNLDNFDIIHVHCPFLGAGNKILAWHKAHPQKQLVITYYRDTQVSDFFSIFIKLYNRIFLPKLFVAARVILCADINAFRACSASAYVPEGKMIIAANQLVLDKNASKLSLKAEFAAKIFLVYNKIVR